MKKILFIIAILMVYPVTVYGCTTPPPSSSPSSTAPSMIGPAKNALGTALQLKETAYSLLNQAGEKGFTISDIADSISEADALLEKAQKIVRVNPIPASNMAREAITIYEKAISDLEALL